MIQELKEIAISTILVVGIVVLAVLVFVITNDLSFRVYEPSLIPALDIPWDGKYHRVLDFGNVNLDISYRK